MTEDKLLDLDVKEDVASGFREMRGGVLTCSHLAALQPPRFSAGAPPLTHLGDSASMGAFTRVTVWPHGLCQGFLGSP